MEAVFMLLNIQVGFGIWAFSSGDGNQIGEEAQDPFRRTGRTANGCRLTSESANRSMSMKNWQNTAKCRQKHQPEVLDCLAREIETDPLKGYIERNRDGISIQA